MNYYSQQDKKTKIRNVFNNNMLTDLKLSQAQINKIIQSGGVYMNYLVQKQDYN